jgi:hypothetical protein
MESDDDLCLYSGFHPTPNQPLDRVDPSTVSAKDFYQQYVAQRKPCVLTHISIGDSVKKLSDLNWLQEEAGDCQVLFERKVNGSFGSGRERERMTFRNFIEKIKQGDESIYKTTQYDDSSQDQLLQPPLNQLATYFPLQPNLLPTLVPQQINLWMGCSSEPVSSGLHHDFADNLYVLLKGTKHFTLYSPKDAFHMYVHGSIAQIHTNGLIVYEDEGSPFLVRADGADPGDVAAWNLSLAEERLKKAHENGDSKEIEQASLEVEELEEELAMYNETMIEEEEKESSAIKRPRLSVEEPNSFSQISPAELKDPKICDEKYPLFKKTHPMTVELNAGEMLYLPASKS